MIFDLARIPSSALTLSRARFCLFLAAAVLLPTGLCVAQSSVVPLADQFQINTYLPSAPQPGYVAFESNENVWVFWRQSSSTETPDESSLIARRFDPTGKPIGPERLVNAPRNPPAPGLYLDIPEPNALVTGADGSSLLAVWTYNRDRHIFGNEDYDIQGRLLGPDGFGDVFQINTLEGIQAHAQAAALDDGSYVVIWRGLELWGRRIGADGSLLGSEFQINPAAFGDGSETMLLGYTVTDLRDGSFMVVWQEQDVESGDISILARSYLYDGTASVEEHQLFTTNQSVTALTLLPRYPLSVTTLPSGGFFMAWTLNSNLYSDMYVQGFDAEWGSLGDPILVGEDRYATSLQPQQVLTRPDGTIWLLRTIASTEGIDVQLERRAADGPLLEESFNVHNLSSGAQNTGHFALHPSGRIVAAWTTFGPSPGDDQEASLQGRIFLPTEIFADGFESGTLDGWIVE